MAEYVHVGEKGVKIMRDKYRADLSIYIYIYIDKAHDFSFGGKRIWGQGIG